MTLPTLKTMVLCLSNRRWDFRMGQNKLCRAMGILRSAIYACRTRQKFGPTFFWVEVSLALRHRPRWSQRMGSRSLYLLHSFRQGWIASLVRRPLLIPRFVAIRVASAASCSRRIQPQRSQQDSQELAGWIRQRRRSTQILSLVGPRFLASTPPSLVPSALPRGRSFTAWSDL